jgi:hypothetical protein
MKADADETRMAASKRNYYTLPGGKPIMPTNSLDASRDTLANIAGERFSHKRKP